MHLYLKRSFSQANPCSTGKKLPKIRDSIGTTTPKKMFFCSGLKTGVRRCLEPSALLQSNQISNKNSFQIDKKLTIVKQNGLWCLENTKITPF